MRITGRKYDDVADIEPNRLALGWYGPATACGDEMI
jgi:hypothetical protein